MTDMQKEKYLQYLENAYKSYNNLLGNFGSENHIVKLYKALIEVLGKGKAVDDQLNIIDKDKNNGSPLINEILDISEESFCLIAAGNIVKKLKAEKLIHKEDKKINQLILDKIRICKDDVIPRNVRLGFVSPKCLRAIENIEIISDISVETLKWANLINA